MTVKYRVSNNETGEVREFEGTDVKKLHRTFRKLVRTDESIFSEKYPDVKVEIEGEEKDELMTKATAYLNKLDIRKGEKPEKKEEEKPNLTELEKKMTEWVYTDGLWNGEWMFSDVTTEDVAKGLDWDVKRVKGVLGSLVKKGYMFTDAVNDNEYDILYLTEEGYKLDPEFDKKWKDQVL